MPEAAASAPDERILGLRAAHLIVGLLAVRVVVAIVFVAGSGGAADEGVLRYDRVAASPVTPYRHFAVEWMPAQTAVVQVVGGRGGEVTASMVTVIAVAADAAVAGALAWGWGLRAAATYLLVGLALLGVAYVRLDLLAVAFATWAFALGRRGRDGPAGGTLAAAALSGLWAAFLLPWAVLRRRRPTLVWAAACLALGGAAWFIVGGPKGPMQVLSYRGATGWDVQSTIGSAFDVVTDDATFLEGGILRIGFAPAWARAGILLVIVAAAAFSWLRWALHGGDPAGRTSLAVAASILALAPTFPPAWASILAPWAAAAWDEEPTLATGAAMAIALTGVLGVVGSPEESSAIGTTLVIMRQLVLFFVAAGALAPRRAI
jgi:hypothetical protein